MRALFGRLDHAMGNGMSLEVDYTLAMADGLGHTGGLAAAVLEAEAPRFSALHARVLARTRSGELGFWNLPRDVAALDAARRATDDWARGARDVLVLGIGGSSLGARALCEALAEPVGPARPRLHFIDNSDPWRLSSALAICDAAQTAVLVVSKSGRTLETNAQLLVVRGWLGGTHDRVLAITDPNDGPLRALATREGWPALPIPKNVGGRFSALTAAGLVPALLSGIDVDALLAGAAEMATRCESPELLRNPAGTLAMLHVLHDRVHGRAIHVMMPYADRLRAFAAWYVQLWAESLGKRLDLEGRVVETGPTPLPAVGATDQHAQLQLFVEGPRDKLVTFVTVEHHERDLTIPARTDAGYLADKTLGALLRAQHEATSEALAADGRPSLTVRLERVDARHVGALLFLYEATTAFAGAAYGVDAFDQPGVELGKRLTDGLLGRPGSDDAQRDLTAARARRLRRHLV